MSVVEDVRKVVQDFLAPELRSIGTRMDGIEKQMDRLEKQRIEDKSDILHVLGQMEKQRVEDKADMLNVIGQMEKQRVEDKADMLNVMGQMEKQRAEDKADMLRAISDSAAHMEKRFELVIDYTKVLQRMDKLEESKQAESH